MKFLPELAVAHWAAQRADNLDRLLAEARRDDVVLFGQALALLDALAHFLTSVGDEAGALFAASLARLLEEKHVKARRKAPRRKISRRGERKT